MPWRLFIPDRQVESLTEVDVWPCVKAGLKG